MLSLNSKIAKLKSKISDAKKKGTLFDEAS